MMKNMLNKKNVSFVVVALLLGYGIGYLTHPTAAQPQNMRGSFTGAGANGGMRGAAGNGFLSGTIASKDSGSITLNTRDGSSHVVLVTPNTSVSKSVSGTLSDVVVGTTVIISGTTNSDGSVSASLIQLRPAMSPATVQ